MSVIWHKVWFDLWQNKITHPAGGGEYCRGGVCDWGHLWHGRSNIAHDGCDP